MITVMISTPQTQNIRIAVLPLNRLQYTMKNDIYIVAHNMEYSTQWDTYVINIEICNNLNFDISYSINRMAIDGFTVDAYAYADIYSKCKDNLQLGFSRSEAEQIPFSEIQTLQFNIIIRNSDTDEIIAIVSADIKTTDYNDSERSVPEFNGTEVYTENGIEIYACPYDTTSVRSPLYFYMINDTDDPLGLMYCDVAYNDEMVMELCSGSYLLPHTKRAFAMDIPFIDDLDISKIEKVDMSLRIQPYGIDGSFSTRDAIEIPRFSIVC